MTLPLPITNAAGAPRAKELSKALALPFLAAQVLTEKFATNASPFATDAPAPRLTTCWVSVVGAGFAGTVTLGVAPKAPETVIPTAVVVVLDDPLDDDPDDDESDDGLGLALEPQAASSTTGTTSNTAIRRGPICTNTPFGWNRGSKTATIVRATWSDL